MEVPEYFIGGYFSGGADQKPTGENFKVDDLLDFPNDEDALMTDGFFDSIAKTATTDSSTLTSNDSCNSSASAGIAAYQSFASELCVPVITQSSFSYKHIYY